MISKHQVKTFFLGCFLLLTQAEAAQRVSAETRAKLQRELPVLDLSVGNPVLIRTFKKESRLEMWVKPDDKNEYILFRTYPICYYSGDLGPKLRTGDKATPEGFYAIRPSGMNPYSRFHLSMDIGYPNAYDRQHGRTGSLLMIHGACDAVGCFAMNNAQVEEIYYLVEQALTNGADEVPVHAFPFHLNTENLEQYKAHKWHGFWTQLQAGYRLFNQRQVPLTIGLQNGHYTVAAP